MAVTRPVFNREAFNQAWQKELAKIEESNRTANTFLIATSIGAVFTVLCGFGVQATTAEPGKKQSLANRVFLGGAWLGAGATAVFLVVLAGSVYSSFKSHRT
jgi:hypothetical protein